MQGFNIKEVEKWSTIRQTPFQPTGHHMVQMVAWDSSAEHHLNNEDDPPGSHPEEAQIQGPNSLVDQPNAP